MTDTSEIYYTNSDDGVWLQCLQCDFHECLGFTATVTDLTAAWSRHKCSAVTDIRTVDGSGPQ